MAVIAVIRHIHVLRELDAGSQLRVMMSLVPDIIAHQTARGGQHHSGALHAEPLYCIEEVLGVRLAGSVRATAETGCGASTLVFSRYARSHSVYCLDDSSVENSSVEFVRTFGGYAPGKINWNFGSTQKTLIASPPVGPLDAVLIDGPHGYPFPDLEYYFFYPLIRPEGFLIVDDIHIPTIRNLFEVLRQDDMFYLYRVVGNTAFFVRSHAPTFTPHGDGWWRQRYNLQHFPAANAAAGDLCLPPIDLDWTDGASFERYLTRGFTNALGDCRTEGPISIVTIPFSEPVTGSVEVELMIEPLYLEKRPDAAMELHLQYQRIKEAPLTSEVQQSVTARTKLEQAGYLEIKVHHVGQKPLQELIQTPMVDLRLFNFRLNQIQVRLAAESDARDDGP